MKKIFIYSTALLLFCGLSYSQTGNTVYLWPGKVPGEIKQKSSAKTSENKDGNTTRLSEVTNPILEIFKPEKEKSNGMAIIVCPGGGYSILAIDKEGYEIAEWLTTLGFTSYVLQYRVPNNQEGALHDIQRALRIVKDRGYDHVGVLGFSAGGSLSARASTRFNASTYPKQDDIDSLSCRPDFAVLIYPAYLDKGESRSITPELTINAQTPPFFIFATADDKHGNSALVMTTALRDNKIPVELHFLPHGGHGYGLRPGNVAAETWPGLLKNWLETTNF